MTVHTSLTFLIALAQAPHPSPDSVVYTLAPASLLEVRTEKSGLLGFTGHEHTIRAHAFSGEIVYYANRPEASHVAISVPAGKLVVLTPPDTAEIRKVTAAMRAEVLEVADYPEIRFASRTIRQSGDTLFMLASLTMHGQTHDVPVVVRVTIASDTLRALSTFTVKQTAFGMRPYRGGPGGTVRVADAVTFTIDAVGVRTASP